MTRQPRHAALLGARPDFRYRGPHQARFEARHQPWLVVSTVAAMLVVAMVGTRLAIGLGPMGNLTGLAVLLGLVAATFIGTAYLGGALIVRLHSRARRRDALAVAGAGWRVCPSCYYDLSGLAESGACPECGWLYSRAELMDFWRRFYRIEIEPMARRSPTRRRERREAHRQRSP